MTMDLFAVWTTLGAPTEPQTWTASHVSDRARVARTPGDGAAVLVKLDNASASANPFRLRTSHIEYTPTRPLSIRAGAEVEAGNYTVLECSGDEPALVRHFLRVAATLPLDGTSAVLDAAVQQVFELFRSFHRRGNNTIQGIWAEALVVAYARSPDYLVTAWHSDSSELHDFVGDGYELELKS